MEKDTVTYFSAFAERIYSKRKNILLEIERERKEREDKEKLTATNYAFWCMRLFSISTIISKDPQMWIKKIKIYEDNGLLKCAVMFGRYEKEETWCKISGVAVLNETSSIDLQGLIEIMQMMENGEVNQQIQEYMVELLKIMQYFDIEFTDNGFIIKIQDIEIVDEK